MKVLRAILLGMLMWVLIFVEISIVQGGFEVTGLMGMIIHYLLLIPITILCALLYYKGRDRINGFLLGLVFLIVGAVLDMAITIPLFVGRDYAGFYINAYMWIGFAVVFLTAGLYDAIVHMKKPKHRHVAKRVVRKKVSRKKPRKKSKR